MSAQRDERGRWLPGSSANPHGRPRSGHALAEAVRERLDPVKVLELVERFLSDESVPLERRLGVALPWLHAGFLRPPTASAVHVTGPPATTARDWDAVPLDECRELLARIRAVPKLVDPRLHEPRAFDDDATIAHPLPTGDLPRSR